MAQDEQLNFCRTPNCTSSELIEAHIVPQGFAKIIRGDDHNVILNHVKTKITPQLGETDWNILCRNCDQKLGIFDEALLDAAKDFRRIHNNVGSSWVLPTIDPNLFSKGVLAILWRASLSQRPGFSNFSLGSYESVFGDILFGLSSFDGRPDISLLVQRYTSKHFDPTRHYTLPVRSPFMGLTACGFGLAGFRFLVKFDPRPIDSGYAGFDVPHSGIVRGLYVEIERTPDFEGIAEMVVGDLIRSKKRT